MGMGTEGAMKKAEPEIRNRLRGDYAANSSTNFELAVLHSSKYLRE